MVRKFFTKLALAFLASTTLPLLAFDTSFLFELGTGYRQDSLNWNFAGPGRFPTVLSELKWKNLHIWQILGEMRVTTCHEIYLKATADYGRIFQGKNRDSDFEKNSRKGEFSRSDNDAGKGEVFDFSGGIGYQFNFFCRSLKFSPLVGYSHHEQHLKMFSGFQTIDLRDPSFENKYFSGLHSSYHAKWTGPWIGFDLQYLLNDCFDFYGGFEYHWAHYRGKGHWNLRTDFADDIKHTARHVHGFNTFLEAFYSFYGNWKVGLKGNYEYWKANHGKHRVAVFGESPSSNSSSSIFIYEARLNKVNWRSFSINATLCCLF